jgi:GT2 family glycosyltransferase
LIKENINDQLKVILADQNGTISKSRNIGAKIAQGEYFAFLDADIDLSSNWLTVMFAQMADDTNRKIVSAYQVCDDDASKLEQIRTVLSNVEVDVNVAFLPGRNLFLHNETFDKVGGFPEHLITCEDYYFTDQISQFGDLYYTSQASYVHLGEDKEWGQLFHKEIWRGQSNLKSLKGRKVPIREYPSLFVPLWLFFFTLCFLFALLAMNTTYQLLCFAALALPVFLYSQRLNNIGRGSLVFVDILKFYIIYFSGRTIGTVIGALKSFQVRNSA